MHCIKIVNKSLHSLICSLFDFLIGKFNSLFLYLGYIFLRYVFFELLCLKLKIIVVPCHARAYAVLLLYICTYLLYQTFLVVYVIHKVKYFGKVLPVCALVGLSYSHCKCVIEIRNGLSAVLVVLI